jgi:hypothetical protein
MMFPVDAFAQDLEISCENDGDLVVSPDPVGSLFDISDFAPGEDATGTIQVTNNDADDVCEVRLDVTDVVSNEDNISDMMFTSIEVDSSAIYGSGTDKTLSDLFGTGVLLLASVNPGDVSTIDWTVTFDPSAGNEYQNKSLSFDFVLNMQWGSEQDGVEGGAVLGASTTSGSGDVLGATGSAIIIPFAVGVIGILAVVLYRRIKKHKS